MLDCTGLDPIVDKYLRHLIEDAKIVGLIETASEPGEVSGVVLGEVRKSLSVKQNLDSFYLPEYKLFKLRSKLFQLHLMLIPFLTPNLAITHIESLKRN